MNKMTLLTVGLLVVGAVAMPAMAQPDHQSDKRADAMEKRDARMAAIHDRCMEKHNSSDRCDKVRDAAEPHKQARREAHALQHAIDALYKRVGKLEMKEYQIEQRMENLTENETAKAESMLERIDAAQEKALERIMHLEAKLEALKEKWAEVRDHVADMRAKRGDDSSEEEESDEESEDDLSDEDDS